MTFPEDYQTELKAGLQAAYLVQRAAFPQNKVGKLTKTGKDEAFQFALGYIIGWHYAKGLFPNQSSSAFLLQVCGADNFAGLDAFGKVKP